MQPILKSKSASFMFHKNFCEMKGKKVIHWAGGAIQIAPWKCNFSNYLDIQVYYLDIKAITTLLGLLLVLYALLPSIYSFFYLTTTLLKSDIFRHSKVLQPRVFNLQASDWLLCEEETGAHYLLHRLLTYKL